MEHFLFFSLLDHDRIKLNTAIDPQGDYFKTEVAAFFAPAGKKERPAMTKP